MIRILKAEGGYKLSDSETVYPTEEEAKAARREKIIAKFIEKGQAKKEGTKKGKKK